MKDHEITSDYRKHLGEPYLVASGYTVYAILQALESEGSTKAVAEAMGVSDAEVRACIEYAMDKVSESGQGELAEAFWEGRQSVYKNANSR